MALSYLDFQYAILYVHVKDDWIETSLELGNDSDFWLGSGILGVGSGCVIESRVDKETF